MTNYFKNFIYTLGMLFWVNIINLVVTITGVFCMIFNRDKWWDWMTSTYIEIGNKFSKVLNEDSEEENLL